MHRFEGSGTSSHARQNQEFTTGTCKDLKASQSNIAAFTTRLARRFLVTVNNGCVEDVTGFKYKFMSSFPQTLFKRKHAEDDFHTKSIKGKNALSLRLTNNDINAPPYSYLSSRLQVNH